MEAHILLTRRGGVARLLRHACAMAVGLALAAQPATGAAPAARKQLEANPVYLPLVMRSRQLAGRLVFVHGYGHVARLYQMHADGTQRRLLSDNRAPDFEPSWSPDGSQVAFLSLRDSRGIYVMRSDGSGLRLLMAMPASENELFDAGPVWSPNGQWIVFGFIPRNRLEMNIYIVPAAGGAVRVSHVAGAVAHGFTWSPDSAQIAFVSSCLEDSFGGTIHVMNADGSGMHPLRVFIDESTPYGLAWSPDGAQILFTSAASAFDDTRDIYTMDADGSSPRPLTSNAGTNYGAAWLLDGRFIVFYSNRDGPLALYVMDHDGASPERVAGSVDGDYDPAWR